MDRLHDKVEGLPTPGTTSPINELHVNYPLQNTTHAIKKHECVCAAHNSLPRVCFIHHEILLPCEFFKLIQIRLFFVVIKDETEI